MRIIDLTQPDEINSINTLFFPYPWVCLGSPCCLDRHREYNLGQNIHNIHYKATYYQAPLLLPLLSKTKKKHVTK